MNRSGQSPAPDKIVKIQVRTEGIGSLLHEYSTRKIQAYTGQKHQQGSRFVSFIFVEIISGLRGGMETRAS